MVKANINNYGLEILFYLLVGSDVEDRQYQFDLLGISVSTGIWEEVDNIFSHTTGGLTSLRGTSENPALEWNNLERGQPNALPSLNLWHVTEKFDISVIAAPAMVYKESTLVCGHSIEVKQIDGLIEKDNNNLFSG